MTEKTLDLKLAVKTVAIARCSQEMQRLLRIAKQEEEDVILRTGEGEEVLLSLIDDFDVEIASQRRNKKLMAFLKVSFRRARKEKGIPLEEVRRRLGLPSRSGNHHSAAKKAMKTIAVSRRSPAIRDLLEQASSEDLILKRADGSEYFLTAIHDGDYQAANRRRSETVMAYLDKRGKRGQLPTLEVEFVLDRPPTKACHVTKPARRRKRA